MVSRGYREGLCALYSALPSNGIAFPGSEFFYRPTPVTLFMELDVQGIETAKGRRWALIER